ncbi:MAG: alginate export family protein [Planctomycetales bacterium]|nr:alginate export family protein [Planctomycetales bacterium]MBN8625333.1 alginate export family protein [Planctomycetota bacterium]
MSLLKRGGSASTLFLLLSVAQVGVATEVEPIDLAPAVEAVEQPTFAAAEPWAREASLSTTYEAPPADAAKKAAELKKKKEALKKAVAGAYKPLFFDNNFAYIDNPLYTDCFCGDRFKQRHFCFFGNCATLDVGGQYRLRQHAEQNMRGLGLTGVDDAFLLQRTRLFANAQLSEDVRVYAEMLDAESNFEDFAPRAIEENQLDVQNLFVDLTLVDGARGNLKFRGGRQELLYGAERLISPLDWANTRRTFEGVKFMWAGEDWNIDAFYTHPVTVAANNWDTPDYRQEFSGVYGTYKAIEGHTFDTYWMSYYNSAGVNSYHYQTNGARWLGSKDAWLWELEGGMQYGENTSGSDHWGTFTTAGVGRKMEKRTWKPTLWAYFDYASGGARRGAGEGFNHLFPLAHKYLGFMDIYGRSNICTPNVQLTMQPHEKVKVLLWYYYFFLEDGRDTPYNINMSAFNAANAPVSRDLGHELDMTINYTLNPRMDILFGYSHFFSGDYYRLTPGVPYRGDANFFYTQYQWNF